MHVSLVRAVVATPIGPLVLDASDDGLRSLYFDPATWPEAGPIPAATGRVMEPGEHPVLAAAQVQLARWFAGERDSFDVPLDLRVRGFAREVLLAMVAIPHGQVRSYGALASSLGRGPGSARAVGRACNTNPLPIVVPCHRVVAADGSLGGYAGGLELKRWLLRHEGAGPAVPPGGWTTRAGRARTADDDLRLF